ncbi:MAG: nuclear transport factor 2 family protein [Bacteroidota bacterium]
MKAIVALLVGFLSLYGNAQTSSITYKTNGLDSLVHLNPFRNFIGEWTLKDNTWTHNWGSGTETIEILNHHTVSTAINTRNSLLQIIDGPQPNGHVLWTYNPNTETIDHLSYFGEIRVGKGNGSFDKNGNLTLRVVFTDEAKDTYRIYKYHWLTKDEYRLHSVQYDSNDKPTALFYEGNFIRLPSNEVSLKNQIETILSIIDNNEIPVEEQLKVYTDDVVHMAPGNQVNIGIGALGKYLREQRQYGKSKMRHQIVEIETFNNVVLMRGEVTGTFYPKNGTPSVAFRTKNLFVFSTEGALKIKKVIYNSSPLE